MLFFGKQFFKSLTVRKYGCLRDELSFKPIFTNLHLSKVHIYRHAHIYVYIFIGAESIGCEVYLVSWHTSTIHLKYQGLLSSYQKYIDHFRGCYSKDTRKTSWEAFLH